MSYFLPNTRRAAAMNSAINSNTYIPTEYIFPYTTAI